jgi:hypothetical protein
MSVQEMLGAHPSAPAGDDQLLIRCIEECLACTQTCTSCADSSIAEDDVDPMRLSIRLCLDCADVCDATGRIAARLTGRPSAPITTVLEACVDACRRCGDECEKHAKHHEHHRLCADECRRCEAACRALIDAM